MADDIDELLDEVESKFIHVENSIPESQEPAPATKRYNCLYNFTTLIYMCKEKKSCFFVFTS